MSVPQKRASGAWASHNIPQIMWYIITCPCPWCMLLAQHYSYSLVPLITDRNTKSDRRLIPWVASDISSGQNRSIKEYLKPNVIQSINTISVRNLEDIATDETFALYWNSLFCIYITWCTNVEIRMRPLTKYMLTCVIFSSPSTHNVNPSMDM